MPRLAAHFFQMMDPQTNAAILEVVMADEERLDQAYEYALYELRSELLKVPHDRKAYERWCRKVDKKAREIFDRLI